MVLAAPYTHHCLSRQRFPVRFDNGSTILERISTQQICIWQYQLWRRDLIPNQFSMFDTWWQDSFHVWLAEVKEDLKILITPSEQIQSEVLAEWTNPKWGVKEFYSHTKRLQQESRFLAQSILLEKTRNCSTKTKLHTLEFCWKTSKHCWQFVPLQEVLSELNTVTDCKYWQWMFYLKKNVFHVWYLMTRQFSCRVNKSKVRC